MASSKDYLDFIMEQLSEAEGVTQRAMMGEYILYCRGKIFGGVYDDRLLVKPTPAALAMLPEAEREQPYPGAKEMLLVDKVEDREFLKALVEAMADELPATKGWATGVKCQVTLTLSALTPTVIARQSSDWCGNPAASRKRRIKGETE